MLIYGIGENDYVINNLDELVDYMMNESGRFNFALTYHMPLDSSYYMYDFYKLEDGRLLITDDEDNEFYFTTSEDLKNYLQSIIFEDGRHLEECIPEMFFM